VRDTYLRKHVPPQRTLLTFTSGGSGTAKTAVFRVPIPDSRLRVKLSVMYIPATGIAVTVAAATLWLYEADVDDSGVQGNLIPCTNIEGTSAAPTALPLAAGLQGYSREFVTAADYIVGRLVASPSSAPGSWVLQARYQPDAVRFTDEEWNALKSQCNPDLSVGPVID
jgi:hypothetical protein